MSGRVKYSEVTGVSRRGLLIGGGASAALAVFGRFFGRDAEARNGNGRKYKTVPAKNMVEWSKQTKPYRHAPDTLSRTCFTTSVKFPYNGFIIEVSAVIDYKDINKSSIEYTIHRKDDNTPVGEVIRFDKVSEEFKQNLRSLTLVVEKGKHDGSEYKQVWAVANGKIKKDVFALPALAFYQREGKDLVGKSSTPYVLA